MDWANDDASDRFRIGLCVNWDIWQGTRATIELDRGPCETALIDVSWWI
jgi:hypothetical protein